MYFENKPTSKPPADPRSQPSFDDEAVGGATKVPRRYAEVVQVCLEGVQFRKDLRGPRNIQKRCEELQRCNRCTTTVLDLQISASYLCVYVCIYV